MKKRLWIGVAAAALAVGGVSVGLVGASQAAPVKAATTDEVVIRGTMTNDNWATNFATLTYNTSTSRFEATFALSAGDQFKVVDVTASKWAGYHSDLGTTVVKQAASDNNIEAVATGDYTVSVSDFSSYGDPSYIFQTGTGSITFAAATTVTVTEYAVVGGVKEATALATKEIVSGSTFAVPDFTARAGYAFGGWFTDEACTTAYAAAAISANTSLYAKYTACATTKYFYFQSMTWSAAYIYTFGQSQAMGAFPGTKVTAVTENVSFRPDTSTGGYVNSWGGIYKVAYYSDSGDTKMVLSDGTDTNKSNDLVITEGAYYDLTNIATADYAGAADKGAAAKVIYDINAAQTAVVASGSILAGSVCGVSKADATTLTAEYNALTDDEKKMCDQSYLNTYNYQDKTGTKVDVSFYQVVEQLNLIAASGSGTASISDTIHENNGLYITLGVLAAGLTAAGAMIFLAKKKKHAVR